MKWSKIIVFESKSKLEGTKNVFFHLLKMGGPSLHLLKINDVGGGNDMIEIVWR